MTRRGLSGSGQPQTKPEKEVGTLARSFENITTIGAGVLAADATRATLNAIFDIQPTNQQVIDEVKQLKQLLLSLERKQVLTHADVRYTTGLVADVVHGLVATGIEAQNAIVASQNARGLNSPKPLETPKLNKPTSGR